MSPVYSTLARWSRSSDVLDHQRGAAPAAPAQLRQLLAARILHVHPDAWSRDRRARFERVLDGSPVARAHRLATRPRPGRAHRLPGPARRWRGLPARPSGCSSTGHGRTSVGWRGEHAAAGWGRWPTISTSAATRNSPARMDAACVDAQVSSAPITRGSASGRPRSSGGSTASRAACVGEHHAERLDATRCRSR